MTKTETIDFGVWLTTGSGSGNLADSGNRSMDSSLFGFGSKVSIA